MPQVYNYTYDYTEASASGSSSASADIDTQMSGGGTSSISITTDVDGTHYQYATTTSSPRGHQTIHIYVAASSATSTPPIAPAFTARLFGHISALLQHVFGFFKW